MAAMMPTGLVVAVFAKATSAEPVRSRARKTRSGISGSATLCSTKRKAASRPRARTIVASVRIEPARRSLPAVGFEQHEGERDARRAEGYVDEEDPLPPEHVGDQTAEDQPGRAPAGRHRRPQSHCKIALAALRERRRDDGEGRRRHDRRPEALSGTEYDQHQWRPGVPA